MADIFLSYSQADRDRVRPLVDALKAQGYSVWWDPEGAAGEDLDDMVNREIREATCIVVVWSASAVESDWVKGEAEEARKQKKLIPVSIDDTVPPLRFGHGVRPDLSGWGGDVGDAEFQQLLKGIGGFLLRSASDIPVGLPTEDRAARRPVLWIGAVTILIAAGMAVKMWTDNKPPKVGDTAQPDIVSEGPVLPSYKLAIPEIHLEDCEGQAPPLAGGKDELCLVMVRNNAFSSKETILGCGGTEYVCGRAGGDDEHAVKLSIDLESGRNSFIAYEEDPEFGICLTRGPVDADDRCIEMGKLEFSVSNGRVSILPGRFRLLSQGEQISPVDIEVEPGRLYEVLFPKTSDGRYRIFWRVTRSD